MSTSPVLGVPYIATQQNQPEVTHNEANNMLQILLAGGALQIGLNTPPGSPTEGDVYVIGPAPTGAWAGRANTIAGFFLGNWVIIPGLDNNGTPINMGAAQEGLQIWDKSTNATYAWTDLGVSPGAYSWMALPTSITTLASLTDTTVTSPSDYEVLTFVNSVWRNRTMATVLVESESDFPTPAAGVITLADNVRYLLVASFSTANRFVAGENGQLTSVNFNAHTLTYTGTDTMFTGVDKDIFIDGIKFDAPSGTVFDWEDTVAKTHIFNIQNCIVVSCAKYGIFKDLLGVNINNANALSAGDGISMLGADNFVLSLTRVFLNSTNGGSGGFIGLDLGSSVSDNMELRDVIFQGSAGAVGISGQTDSANIAAGETATVNSCAFLGGLTALAGITTDDIRWDFKANSSGIMDTEPDALISMNGNATDTVIAAVNTPTLVAGTFTEDAVSHFTSDANGRITYIGERDIALPVDITVSMAPVSGSNKVLKVYLAINGTAVSSSGMRLRTDSSDPKSVATFWQVVFTTNDYIEIFVENATDAIDILVEDAIFRVR